MSEQFGNPMVDMLLANGESVAPSVAGELTRQRFEGDRSVRQVESRWVADPGPLPGTGHWEAVEVFDAGPADVGF